MAPVQIALANSLLQRILFKDDPMSLELSPEAAAIGMHVEVVVAGDAIVEKTMDCRLRT